MIHFINVYFFPPPPPLSYVDILAISWQKQCKGVIYMEFVENHIRENDVLKTHNNFISF